MENAASPEDHKPDSVLIESISQAVAAAVSTLTINTPSLASINAVALKLPGFWTTNPVSWFSNAEANFRIKNIVSDSTRFFHIVQALDSDTSAKVHRFVSLSDDIPNRYTQLKTALLDACGKSKADRWVEAMELASSSLSSTCPREVGQRVQFLMEESDHPCMKTTIYLRLPSEIRLAVRPHLITLSLTEFCNVAQEAINSTVKRAAVLNVNDSSTGFRSLDESSDSDAVVAEVRTRANTKSKPHRSSTICKFHQRFGPNAYS